MLHEKILQTLANTGAFLRPFDNALIKDDPDADIPTFQRNPPTPPTVPNDMIGRRVTKL